MLQSDDQMTLIKFMGILIGMHITGSAFFFGYLSGLEFALGAPILGLFGWYFIIPEAFALYLLFAIYNPKSEQKLLRTISIGTVYSIAGAVMIAQFVPKEVNNELNFWIGGFWAGASAALFSFTCVHRIKIKTIEDNNS